CRVASRRGARLAHSAMMPREARTSNLETPPEAARSMHHLIPALLAFSSLPCLATGQFWPTVTTTTNMGTFSTYSLPNLTNGLGLSSLTLAATHWATFGQMWMSNAVLTGWLQFDLGSIQPIATIAVWNYNYSSGTTIQRGVQNMNVSLSLDGNNFTPFPPQ